MDHITPGDIKAQKNGAKLVCLTAYTARLAELLSPHVDVLLVGDSLGMVLYGLDTTIGVDMHMMVRHGQAVVRGARKATEGTRPCIVVDMPYGSYEESPAQALSSARRLMDETGADAVKLEGGVDQAASIAALVQAGIPVMAHIGLQPQSVEREGGYKIKGKSEEEILRLLEDASAVEDAGAFSVVVEGTRPDAAVRVSSALSIPTIGIGASASCDGQILVSEDMLGLNGEAIPKFVKLYGRMDDLISEAGAAYAAEVRSGAFPAEEYTYAVKKAV